MPDRVCDKCYEHEAMHHETVGSTNRKLCCECYVKEGNPPADWHTVCMRVYKEERSKT